MKTVFLRALEADDKASSILQAIGRPTNAVGNQRFKVDPRSFSKIPSSPFAYWISDAIRDLFANIEPLSNGFLLTSGTGTLDDFRFLGLWWELPKTNLGKGDANWPPFAKGGSFSPYYFDHHLNVEWSSDGAQMKAWIVFRYGGGHWARNIRSTEHYFRPGLTWPRRTNGLSLRVMPRGCIFADKGPAAFDTGDDPSALLALAAITNSAPFTALVSLQLARTELAQSYEVGLIQQTPVPKLTDHDEASLAALARRAWSLKRSLDTRNETSHAFTLPALLQAPRIRDQESGPIPGGLAGCAVAWSEHAVSTEAEMAAIQSEIDERCFSLYGIGPEDRRAIRRGAGSSAVEEAIDDAAEDDEPEVDTGLMVGSLLSWAAGVVFGRFDMRLATGERQIPAEPEPFDPLPGCSPGMLAGDDGLPLPEPPVGYRFSFPPDGILVDDPGHSRDLEVSTRLVFEQVFDGPDTRWQEAAELVGPGNGGLRVWFARNFFAAHVRRYSKSRRKAPIYWQLATPSASYSVWSYYHRFTRDTFFKVLNDYVAPKVQHEERKLTALVQEAGPDPSGSQRKDIARQEAFVEELRAFRDEVKRVAPLWNPNLNDGVIINFAPLWRLVPQHKAWQKECKACWDKLVNGDYDWTHLAMHLWPERVVPKCAEDRSLAIAHGLEEFFWREDDKGKWSPRQVEKAKIDAFVLERTSAAVKAALDDLLSAPAPVGTKTKKGRKSSSPRNAKA